VRAIRLILFPWQARWNILRLAVAAFIAWVLAADTSARWARLTLASLPDADVAGEVRMLRLCGRYGEALALADEALAWTSGPAREALLAEARTVRAEHESIWRRIRDAGLGALSGRADTLEGLLGAVAADMLIVGDVRDLLIEGGKLALDGESDELVLALSGAGLITTLAPEIDWVPSLMKAAKRAGTMRETLGTRLISLLRAGDGAAIESTFADVKVIASRASPGGTMRMLACADSPEDIAALARFIERCPGGAGALHVGGQDAATLVKQAAAAAPRDRALIESSLIAAARKGPRGVAFVARGSGRAMLRPHPLIGLLKGLHKGTISDLLATTVDRLDGAAWWVLPAAVSWVLFEGSVLVMRFARTARTAPQ
jgi:hypothetical protein